MNVTCGCDTMVRDLVVDLDKSLDENYILENIFKKGNSRAKCLWRHAKQIQGNV